ncbi:hypothetical protein ACFL6I_26640 [candidate division KSB1 bacterium]
MKPLKEIYPEGVFDGFIIEDGAYRRKTMCFETKGNKSFLTVYRTLGDVESGVVLVIACTGRSKQQ